MSTQAVRLVISADASGAVSGARQTQAALGGVEQQVQSLTQHAARMGHALVAAFSVREVARFYLEASKTSIEMAKLANTMRFASGSGAELGANNAFLRRTVQDLGLDVRSAGAAFASLAAAARGTALEGAGARSIFDAVAKASTALGLSAQETQGSLLAIQQMISKGTVSAEELRGQLDERLPGAFQIAARAMGVTTQELGKMLEQGQLATDVFLPRFAAQMRLEMGGAALSAADSVQANLNRMGTAWTDLQTTVAQSDFNNESLKGLTEALRTFSGALKDNQVDAKAWGKALPEILVAAADVALTVGSAFRQAGLDIGWYVARLGSLFQKKGYGAALDAARAEDWKPALRTDFTDQLNALRAGAGAPGAQESFRQRELQDAKDRALLATRPDLGGNSAGAAAGAEQRIDAERRLISELRARLEVQKAEIEQGGPLSAVQREYAEINSKIADGQIKLSAAGLANVRTIMQERLQREAAIGAAKDEARWKEEAAKASGAVTLAALDSVDAIAKEVAAAREHNATIGKTVEQLAALERARLDDALATAGQSLQDGIRKKVNTETLAALTLQVEELRKLKALKEEGVILQTTADAAKDAAAEWQRTADSIYNGLTDSLFRAFEGGKGFFKTFWDGLQNLFKTTVLRIGVQAVMQGTGLSGLLGLAGPAQAAGGSGILGSLGSAGSLLGGLGGSLGAFGGAFGGAFATGVTGALNGAGLGGMLGGAGQLVAGGSPALGAGLGLGAVAPYAAAAVVAGVLLKKAFGMGPKQTTGTGISGTVSGGDVTAQNFADWTKEGGWFRSDKHGTDISPLSDEQTAGLKAASAAVYAQTQEWAKALQLPAESLAKVSYDLRIRLGADEAANTEAINAAFGAYQDKLAAQFKSLLVPFQHAGETLTQAMGRLAGLETFSAQLNQLGGIFSRLANLSVDARENMIALAGGMESLAAQGRSFAENYYSRDELAGLKANEIQKALAAAGVTADVGSRDEFRALVESRDVTTAPGREQLAVLLQVADSFAGLTDYLAETGKSLDTTAAQAPAFDALGSIFSASAVQQVTAINAVQASVDAVRAAIEKSAAEAAAAAAAQQARVMLDAWREVSPGL